MRRLSEIERERDQINVILGLTRAFEGIASMRVAQVRDQTLMSGKFFADLWRIYSQLRVDEDFRFGRGLAGNQDSQTSDKELQILITSEGGLSGDIDNRLVKAALSSYQPSVNDIVVIGNHGAGLLAQHGIKPVKSFHLPIHDSNINVSPLLGIVQNYRASTVYWENYVSIMTQDVKTIQLAKAMAARGRQIEKAGEEISEQNYIFEPSTYEVVGHLERTMVQVMLSELILESKLAQYASRFKAMSAARQKASDGAADLDWLYSLSKRRFKDERLKSMIYGLRKPTL